MFFFISGLSALKLAYPQDKKEVFGYPVDTKISSCIRQMFIFFITSGVSSLKLEYPQNKEEVSGYPADTNISG